MGVPASQKKIQGRVALARADDNAAETYDLSAHQTLSRVVLLIRENYVEPDRIKPYEMFLAALDYIQRSVAEVLVDDSHENDFMAWRDVDCASLFYQYSGWSMTIQAFIDAQ